MFLLFKENCFPSVFNHPKASSSFIFFFKFILLNLVFNFCPPPSISCSLFSLFSSSSSSSSLYCLGFSTSSKVAEMISGKTVSDSSFTLELVDNNDFYAYRKSSNGAKGPNHERKKGIPWTIEEHRLFLLGLKKYGKGDWRNISRNFVDSKTPTQVASHAQKYQKWNLSRGKDEKKPSIHDVTVLDLTGTAVFSDDRKPPSANQSNVASQQKPASMSKTSPNDGSATVFGLVNGQYVKSRL